MTNQSLDIQPALRSFNVLVRGGRLTRFKGRVASIAPGLLVLATATVLFTGGAVQAACTITDGEATCPADSDDTTPGNQPYSSGIAYVQSDEVHTLTLPDDPEFTVLGKGVDLDYGSDENVSVHMTNGTVNATEDFWENHGVSARTTGRGSVEARLSGGGKININHTSTSAALRARIDNGNVDIATRSDADATAVMDGGEITITNSVFTEGVSAFTSGFGNAIAEMHDGLIVTKAGVDGTIAVNASVHNNNENYEGRAVALMTGGVIETRNNGGIGMRATTRGVNENSEAFVHMSGGKVTTYAEDVVINEGTPDEKIVVGGRAHAIAARLGDIVDSRAKTRALMTGGEIETKRSNSAGVQARNRGLGNAFVQMDETHGPSTIITHGGSQAHGLQAFATPHHEKSTAEGRATAAGVAEAVLIAGSITVHADSSFGAYAQANGVLGKALTRMQGGSITMHGNGTAGLYARIDNSANEQETKIFMDGGSIETNGWGSHGLFADTSGSGNLVVDMQRGTITTRGNGSHGIWAESEAGAQANRVRFTPGSASRAKAFVTLGAHATVTASGAGADGIRVSGNLVDLDDDTETQDDIVRLGARGFDIDVAGSVTGGHSHNAAAIRTISSDTGTIDIFSGAKVTAGGPGGVAIYTQTAGAAGEVTEDDDGTAFITSEGEITGDILLYAGDDTLLLKGGSFAGGIYGGDGNNEVTISAAVTYGESHTLDGGAGTNDRLTLRGQTVRNTAENFLNWEHVALEQGAKLSLSGVSTLDTALDINAGSEFRAIVQQSDTPTEMIIARDVTNNGSAVFSVQDGATGDEIRIEGKYSGSGTSVFALDAVVNGNDTDVDNLVITGNASGEMLLSVTDLARPGEDVTALEVDDVVTVTGDFNGTFTLVDGNYVMSDGEHGVIAGAYLYTLAETGGTWALSARSEAGEPMYQPSAPIYDSYGPSLLTLNAVSSLRNRGSSQDFRSLAWDGGPVTQAAGSPLWVQMGTEQVTLSEEHSTTGAALDSSLWELEIGGDIVLRESGAGLLVGGLMLSYATGSTDVSSAFGDGSIDTTGLGLGLAATWYDTRRFYVDGQLTWASYSSDLSADRFGALTEGNSGTGYAVSIEAGQQLDLGSRLSVIPQAQLSLSTVAFSDFTGVEDYAERVAFEDASSQQLRLGLEFGAQDPGASGVYGLVNLFHEFGAGSEVDLSGVSLTTESEPWALGVGLGGRYAWSDRVDFFGEASYATGLSTIGDTSALSASAGLKVVF